MKAALGHPALATMGALGALLGFTWPLLVFDRPLYVLLSFFVIWAAAIGLLYLASRAPESAAVDAVSDAPPASEEASARRN